MEVELNREEKYWPQIDKWVVCYIAPQFGHIMENSFNKDKDVADKEALKGIKKRINYQLELQVAVNKSTITITL